MQPPARTFAVSLGVGAGGSVAGPGGTPCTGLCTADVASGSVLTLVATAMDGYVFSGWTGACSGSTPSCVVTIDGATSVGAAFAAQQQQTTIVVSASVSSSVFGEPVAFSAALTTVIDHRRLTGVTVRFVDAATTVGIGITDGEGIAWVSAKGSSMLTVGSHLIEAIYDGDSGFLASSSTMPFTVTRAQTRTTVTASPTPSVSGQLVTFTAIVAVTAPGAGSPTGSVSFLHVPTGATLGRAAVDAAGTAALTTSALPEGTFGIQAVDSGNAFL